MTSRAAAKATAFARRCPVCWEDIQAPVVTGCGHRFCEECIKAALNVKKECPTCRARIPSHRSLRADAAFAELTETAAPTARIEADGISSAPSDSWPCTSCTLSNPMAVSRCMACAARRPTAPTVRSAEPRLARSGGKRVRDADGGSQMLREELRQAAGAAATDGGDREAVILDGVALPVPALDTSAKHSALLYQGGRLQRRKMAGADAPATEAEPLPLVRSIWHSKSGYKNVTYNASEKAKKKPWQARADDHKSLGMFATAEEAAARYSRHLGPELAASLAAAVEREATPMSSQEALRLAESEGLTLETAPRSASSKDGERSQVTAYKGVFDVPHGRRRFLARFQSGGRTHTLGCFHTAELGALEIARAKARL